jgi:hypothetical protein
MADAPRLITVEEANRVLPLLRPIVRELLATYAAWGEAVGRFDLAQAARPPVDGLESPEAVAARREVEAHGVRIDECVEEIRLLGGIFKGLQDGQVDFLSLRDDRPVFLCWKLGEDRVSHWHDIDGGFGGRHPIDSHLFSEMT